MLGQFDDKGKLIYKVEKKIDLGITERPIETWYYGNRIESASDLVLFKNNKYANYYSDNHGDVYQTYGIYTKKDNYLILNDTIGFYQNLADKKMRKLTKSKLSIDTLFQQTESGAIYYSNDTTPSKYYEFNWRSMEYGVLSTKY